MQNKKHIHRNNLSAKGQIIDFRGFVGCMYVIIYGSMKN